MRYFLKSTVTFLLFLIVIYSLLAILWGTYVPKILKPNLNIMGPYGHTFSLLEELKTYGEVDILFLGSSHSYRGFDPRIFEKKLSKEIKTFNLGSSSQTPIQTEVLLNRYLDKLNPKTIIFEVYIGNFSGDGFESSLDIIANDINDLHSVKMAMKINNIKTWNALIVAFFQDLFHLHSDFKEPIQKGEDRYIHGGYAQREISHFQPQKYKKKRKRLREGQIDSFERCLSLIKARNIKLILVYAPITTVLYESFTNNAEFDNLMLTYGDYYNFNKIMKLDDSLHFYDSHHLNQLGVNRFNEKLIDVLFSEK